MTRQFDLTAATTLTQVDLDAFNAGTERAVADNRRREIREKAREARSRLEEDS